jgi:hypothetical protein
MHELVDGVEGRRGDLAGAFVALAKDGSEVVALGCELGAAGADRSEVFVERVGDVVLEGAGAAVGNCRLRSARVGAHLQAVDAKQQRRLAEQPLRLREVGAVGA